LDPIFWLHHANIDRLWEVWLRRDPATHVNPVDNAWLKNVPFSFHDNSGQVQTLTPQQVLDTKATPLLYEYEDVSDPIPAAVQPAPAAARRFAMAENPIPEMVAASDKSVVLSRGRTDHILSINEPTGPSRFTAAAGGPQRVYLNLENITGSGTPGGYALYLNLPEGADHRQHEDLFVGILSLFGLVEASEPSSEHGGAGLRYALNATDVINRLRARPGWDPQKLTVAFVYRGKAEETPDVRVGRVSLYYA
jgi:tyrosinase